VKAFAYVNAANEKEAIAALGQAGGARGRFLPIAGGMDVLGLMKDYVIQPERLVNVKGLDATITSTPDGGLKIGAAVRLTDLVEHAAATKAYPALIHAALEVGTPQIRNQGTVGGNITQRPRCWYFRNEEFHCLKKGGARCFAVEGENQYHAIFGEGPCHIVHPSNLAVPIIAYGGRFRVAGPSGEREVDAGEFFEMPDRNMFAENVLKPDELLTHVILPSAAQMKSATYEVRFKQAHDWPLGVASVVLAMNGDTVRSARVVMGAVAPIPWRSQSAEAALTGKKIDENVAAAAAEAAVQGAMPMRDNGYKVMIARTAVKRAILQAAGIKTV
jgi:xanthine dehydrogenase YagS FAD-binding subunit